jgi:hypothetical protein
VEPDEQMEANIGVPEPVGRPIYDLMADMPEYVAWQSAFGDDQAEGALKAEMREAMDEVGIRVVLWYGERIKDLNAQMGEWIT